MERSALGYPQDLHDATFIRQDVHYFLRGQLQTIAILIRRKAVELTVRILGADHKQAGNADLPNWPWRVGFYPAREPKGNGSRRIFRVILNN